MKHDIIRYKSPTGAEGIIINIPDTKVVDMVFNLRAGYAYGLDLENKIQTPHVLEHILAGYTANHPDPAEFDKIRSLNGAYTNASTSVYDMNHIATCPKFEWERIFKLQIETLDTPSFTEENFGREIENVRSELVEKINNPGYVIGRSVGSAMGIPNRPAQDHIDSLENITLQDVVDNYRHTYHLGNLRFVIAGSFDGDEIEQIKQLVDGINLPTGGERFDYHDPNTIHSADPILIQRSDTPSLTFAWAVMVNRNLSEQQCADLSVLNDLLCDGMDSRIYGQARNRGLLYWFSSGCGNFAHNNEWSFDGNAGADKIEEVIDLIVDELERIKAGDISDEEVEAIKLRQLGSHSMREIKRTHDICNFYRGRYFYRDEIRDFDEIEKMIKNVDRERMVETARQILAEGSNCFGVYGNTDQALVDKLNAKLQTIIK